MNDAKTDAFARSQMQEQRTRQLVRDAVQKRFSTSDVDGKLEMIWQYLRTTVATGAGIREDDAILRQMMTEQEADTMHAQLEEEGLGWGE